MAESYFKRLAEDLLHLEVNTIIKSQMSGQKMPDSSRRTLYEIAYTYSDELIRIGTELIPEGNTTYPGSNGFRGEINWEFGGLGSFEELKTRAWQAVEWIDKQPKDAFEKDLDAVMRDKKMLGRIQDNSHRILGIFFRLAKKQGLVNGDSNSETQTESHEDEMNELIETIKTKKSEDGSNASDTTTTAWNNDVNAGDINNLLNENKDLELDVRELMMIKKAWDIGVEEIMVQTIVGVDGDVTTRILERFANDPDQTVLDLHNEGLKTSIGFWYKMVDTVTQIVGSTIGTILGNTEEKTDK